MIRVVTDSTCDLPQSIIEALGITVQPLHIQVGDDSFLDGVDITREQFYQRLPTFHTHPTTAAPGIGVFSQTYQTCADAGASEILSIHISESLSATVSVARLAAAKIPLFQLRCSTPGSSPWEWDSWSSGPPSLPPKDAAWRRSCGSWRIRAGGRTCTR